jgi:hypothetical protein
MSMYLIPKYFTHIIILIHPRALCTSLFPSQTWIRLVTRYPPGLLHRRLAPLSVVSAGKLLSHPIF